MEPSHPPLEGTTEPRLSPQKKLIPTPLTRPYVAPASSPKGRRQGRRRGGVGQASVGPFGGCGRVVGRASPWRGAREPSRAKGWASIFLRAAPRQLLKREPAPAGRRHRKTAGRTLPAAFERALVWRSGRAGKKRSCQGPCPGARSLRREKVRVDKDRVRDALVPVCINKTHLGRTGPGRSGLPS
jgi:hypothetical protein